MAGACDKRETRERKLERWVRAGQEGPREPRLEDRVLSSGQSEELPPVPMRVRRH